MVVDVISYNYKREAPASQQKPAGKKPRLEEEEDRITAAAMAMVGQIKRKRNAITIDDLRVENGEEDCKKKGEDVGGDGEEHDQSDHEQVHIWTERERRKKMKNMFINLHTLLPQLPPKADKTSVVDEAVNYIKTLESTLHRLQKQKLDKMRERNLMEMSIIQTPTSETSYRELPLSADYNHNWNMKNTPMSSTVTEPSPTATSTVDPAVNMSTGVDSPSCFQTWSSPNVVLSISGNQALISVCAESTKKKTGVLSAIFQVLEEYKLDVLAAHVTSDTCRFMCIIHTIYSTSGVSVPDQQVEILTLDEVYKSAAGDIIPLVTS